MSRPANTARRCCRWAACIILTGGSKSEGPRHLRDDARPLQPQAGRACDRGRRHRHRRGRQAAGHRRQARGAHARRLRLRDDRHVRLAMARAGRRGGGGRRPHHRRRLRASGRQGAGMGGHRHQDRRAPLDAGPLLQGLRAWPRLGRHHDFRSAGDPRRLERQEGRTARPVAADGVDHRRAVRLLRARRRIEARRQAVSRSACADRSG